MDFYKTWKQAEKELDLAQEAISLGIEKAEILQFLKFSKQEQQEIINYLKYSQQQNNYLEN